MSNTENRRPYFPDSKSQSILKELRQRLSDRLDKAGKPPLLVIDLDSTVFDTSHRTGSIFRDFAKNHSEEWSDLISRMVFPETMHEVYQPDIWVEKNLGTKLSDDERLVLRKWWRKHFFRPNRLQFDVPYPGAAEYLRSCEDLGILVKYLTGRADNPTRDETIAQLQRHHFPLSAPDSDLMMKDDPQRKDTDFKGSWLKRLRNDHFVVYIDNEVELAAMAWNEIDEVDVIYFNSVHSGRGSFGESQPPTICSWILET